MKTLGEGWWGFQLMTPSELTNHFHGGRNPCLTLYRLHGLIVGWFSFLIKKTVLDRYRQVVNTNTFVLVFLQVPWLISLPTYSKQLKPSIISLITTVGSNARAQHHHHRRVVMLFTLSHSHSHFILCTCKHLYF
jgi:hypothetical protein